MDIKQFTSEILPFKNKLYRFAYRIVGSAAEAEDVVQEVMIKLWNQRHKLHEYNNIEAWCIRVTKNLSIDKTRSKHYKLGAIPEGFDITSDQQTPHQATETQDTMQRIKKMINQLPPKQRDVIHLRDIEGLSYKEIETQLEMPMNQVKVYLFRARKFIKSQLINSDSYGL
ncbi:MAG TPA: sigma-70 family RNA polymerase sigma factor [Phaeodactylibacter sp.]|nr:sigma-70 family RNA polymerase sigma factor [Phaeodactylibacter sp.]